MAPTPSGQIVKKIKKIGSPNSKIYLIENLLSTEEVGVMLAEITQRGDLTVTPEDGFGIFETVKILDGNIPVCQKIINKLEKIVLEIFDDTFIPITLPDLKSSIKIQKVGQKHPLHSDSSDTTSSGGVDGQKVFLSAVVSLYSGYEGGETVFPNEEVVIKLNAGSAIIYSSNGHYHAVNEVTRGNRYTFLTFWDEKIN